MNNLYPALFQRVVRVLDIAGGVMEELASPSGPKKEFVNSHCREFMQSIKVGLPYLFFTRSGIFTFKVLRYQRFMMGELCFFIKLADQTTVRD